MMALSSYPSKHGESAQLSIAFCVLMFPHFFFCLVNVFMFALVPFLHSAGGILSLSVLLNFGFHYVFYIANSTYYKI